LEKIAASNGAGGQAQDESLVTWAPSLTRSDGRLDWQWPATDIHNRVRGFNPWPGTFAFARGERLKILATRRASGSAPEQAVPGTILQATGGQGWLVAAGQHTQLWVLRVQCANKSGMTAQDYTCGHRFGAGDRLE
jgi:methionyl-tRNA formyltransferase